MLSVLVWLAMQRQGICPYNGTGWPYCVTDAVTVVGQGFPEHGTQDLDPNSREMVPLTRYQVYGQCLSASRGVDDEFCIAPTDECMDGDAIRQCDTIFRDATLPTPKPAEHVIEIKTVRKRHDTGKMFGCIDGALQCISPDKYPTTGSTQMCAWPGTKFYDQMREACEGTERVTRELWIDGQKFGVIKGLE